MSGTARRPRPGGVESDDPTVAGTMTMSWLLTAVPGGTNVEIRADDVPPGISEADHATGLASSLDNLASFVERPTDD